MLLAIDTSTHISSVALYDERGVLAETTWQSHENHTRSLMPQVVRLQELVKSNASDLRVIAAATGPGSFTGLRIGLAAAKGMAFSLNAALIGIPTLDITANAFAEQLLPVCAVLQAGRNRFGAAVYVPRDGIAQRSGDYFFGTAQALAAHLDAVSHQSPVLVCGELTGELRAVLLETLPGRVIPVRDGMNVRRAGILAALAWQRWTAGESDDIQTLAPFYIPTASLA